MEGYRNVALYNGRSWDMGDTDPTTFLNEALVPTFPDLRGASHVRTVNEARQEVVFEFQKRAGQKG